MSPTPPEGPVRLRLHLTPGGAAAVREGHPWVFESSVVRQNRAGASGDLAALYDARNRFLGIGLFDPDSPIRARVLHAGEPVEIDAGWRRRQLERPLRLRSRLFDERTTGYRCIHGESDGWPGLVLDRYAGTLVLKLYTAAWFPHLPHLLPQLQTETAPHDRIVLRLSRNIQAAAARAALSDGDVISGPLPEGPVEFLENGIRFQADTRLGQKTGFFLDQRENRSRVEGVSGGRRVLNAFSFTGGFSLYAARGGAASVTDLDISAHALEEARRNFELNRHDPAVRACRRREIQADAFDWLRKSSERFDLVVLDPPSLARRESQQVEALRAYGRLARAAAERLERNGVLAAASCSAHVSAEQFFTAVRTGVRNSGRFFRELATTGHPPDHPASFPEAKYLKCIYLQLG